MNKSDKIFVAGHKGMVGSALIRALKTNGYDNVVIRTRSEVDLLDQSAVFEFISEEKPDYIFVAAAKVGGINANNLERADFIYENLVIEANIIGAAHKADVQHLLLLGSSCIYPRDCPQPIREEYLLTGPLESTNEPYAIAKIAGIKLCESFNVQYGRAYCSVMPTNLYGPNDNYDLESSHVLPALIRKAEESKACGKDELVVWGSGLPRREFLHVDDLARACLFLMENDYRGALLNIGTGEDVTIKQLAEIIMSVVGLDANIRYDGSKPDGTPRKLLDISRISNLGWKPTITLQDGIRNVYQDFLRDRAG